MRALLTVLLASFTGAAPLAAQVVRAPAGEAKNPTTARLIGIFPGAGHVYAAEPMRGLAFFGGMVGVAVVGATVLAVDCVDDVGSGDETCDSSGADVLVTGALLGVWGWSIWDAGRAAERTNARRGVSAALTLAPARQRGPSGASSPGVRVGMSLSRR
jgi:hypothetical protein